MAVAGGGGGGGGGVEGYHCESIDVSIHAISITHIGTGFTHSFTEGKRLWALCPNGFCTSQFELPCRSTLIRSWRPAVLPTPRGSTQ